MSHDNDVTLHITVTMIYSLGYGRQLHFTLVFCPRPGSRFILLIQEPRLHDLIFNSAWSGPTYCSADILHSIGHSANRLDNLLLPFYNHIYTNKTIIMLSVNYHVTHWDKKLVGLLPVFKLSPYIARNVAYWHVFMSRGDGTEYRNI